MTVIPRPRPCPCVGRKYDLKKVRIGYFEDDERTPVTAETRAAVRTAANALKRAGFRVEPFRPEGLSRRGNFGGSFLESLGECCCDR